MSVTIYHNPSCGTSRNTLAMIRQSGIEPTVIEYLKTPPSREELKELVSAMGIPVRALLREKGTPYKELGLDDPKWTDDQLLDQMLAHPILINRPIDGPGRISSTASEGRHSLTPFGVTTIGRLIRIGCASI